MTLIFLEFCLAPFAEDLDLFFSKESEFYVILEEMQYLRLTLLQEGSWKDIIECNSWQIRAGGHCN